MRDAFTKKRGVDVGMLLNLDDVAMTERNAASDDGEFAYDAVVDVLL